MTAGPMIRVEDAEVRFGDVVALDGFSLDVPASSLVAIVGPSGCGKTTALRAIAGFEEPQRGSITIRDTIVLDDSVSIAPERRRVGMVFQEFALFPHITVAENVGYGVRGSGRVRRVSEALSLVGLDGYDNRFPHELSGGEQQRVALARALAPEPDVVLLDEPFSNLDAPQRERLRRELRAILRTTGVTAIFVTHDQAEALAIADHIAVMRDGRVAQAGPPDEVYASPASAWIGTFLGDATVMSGSAQSGAVETMLGPVATSLPDGTAAQVLVRPEWVVPVASDGGDWEVVDREFYGHDQRITMSGHTGETVESIVSGRIRFHIGDHVGVEVLDALVFGPDATRS